MKKNYSLLLICFLLPCASIQAAEITAISKKSSMVKINESAKKGSNVCFHKGKREVGCGKVVKSTGTTSFVKIETSLLEKLKKGMKATVAGGNSSGLGSEADGESSATKSIATGAAPYKMGLYLIYDPSLMGPSSFKTNVTYKVPPADGSATTLFESADYGMVPFSFGVQGDMFISPTFGIGAGLRFRMFKFNTEIMADYIPTSTTTFASTSENATAMGFFVSGFYYYGLGSGMGLKLGTGLDIDMSTVAFTAGQFTDGAAGADPTENGELYSLKSKLMVVSLKLDAFFNMLVFGPVAIDVGTSLFVPVMSSRSGKPVVNDANVAKNANVDGEKDLVDAIDHKATFGVELLLAAGYTF